ncbi:hypothetical protein KTR10_03160 [Candidatus Kaiserbacteria bacterium]|nr:hypothetical protein [Candidatus Kaiserbacteria bacterium]
MQSFLSKKKGSYHRNSKVGKTILIAVIALLVIYFGRGLIGATISTILRPLYIAENTLSDSTYFSDRETLREQIISLEGELRERGVESEELIRLRNENEELRGVLGRSEEEDRIAVSVIAQPPYMPYDALLIDAGSRDGIKEGAVVYHYGDRAVGLVSKVFERSALVTLFSTPDVETTVYILGPDIFTTAYGVGDGTVRVSVPQDIALSEEDIVILPSLETGVLGTITTVDRVITEPEQHGYIVGEVSLQSLRVLAVSREVTTSVSFEEALLNIEAEERRLLTVPVPEEVIIEVATTTVDGI